MKVEPLPARYKIVYGTTHDLPDVVAFINKLNSIDNAPIDLARNQAQAEEFSIGEEAVTVSAGAEKNAALFNAAALFDGNEEIVVTRAPGRLDVMGGIADYSGSLVLQMPIADATLAALQRDARRTLIITSQIDAATPVSFTMPLSGLEHDGAPVEYEVARRCFQSEGRNRWAAYVAGVFLVLMRERGVRFDHGARLLIWSNVPQGKGVSSSAALEVAVMSAVSAAFDLELEASEIALLCQRVENSVVGAPCGVMDQMTAACGEANRLLQLLCQPAELLGKIALPDDVKVWGLDSGVRHSVAGSDYGSVRTGAFMGYRIILAQAGFPANRDDAHQQTLQIVDRHWNGYLANMTPSEFEQHFAGNLPERMSGAEFLRTYSGTTDSVTQVDASRDYAVRQPAAHAVYENFRVRAFAELMHATASERRRELLGELMYQSHASYSACGLGSPATDLLVHLVRQTGPGAGLYGAKITGGGSGGTVAVLAAHDSDASVAAVAEAFEQQTKHKCAVFSGSSPGSAAFGHLKLRKGL